MIETLLKGYVLTAAVALSIPFLASAATVSEVVEEDRPYIGIEGDISAGDFAKVSHLAGSLIARGNLVRILINSAGGDAIEAMKIGRFVRSALVEVKIKGAYMKPNSRTLRQCYSACVLIFVAAAKRDYEMDNEFYHEDGSAVGEQIDGGWRSRFVPVVGIHRPYFDKKAYGSLQPEQARSEYAVLESMTREYLAEMGAPELFVSQMFRHSSNDILLISKKDFIAVFGYEEPFLEEWFISKCGSFNWQERSDFADILAERIIRNDNAFLSDNFSSGYADYLRNKEKEVTACKNSQLIKHQESALHAVK